MGEGEEKSEEMETGPDEWTETETETELDGDSGGKDSGVCERENDAWC